MPVTSFGVTLWPVGIAFSTDGISLGLYTPLVGLVRSFADLENPSLPKCASMPFANTWSAVISIVPLSITALCITTVEPAHASCSPSTNSSVGLILWLISRAFTTTLFGRTSAFSAPS